MFEPISLKRSSQGDPSTKPFGQDGRDIELQTDARYIQWRYKGFNSKWINLIAIKDLRGDTGPKGLQGEKGAKGDQGEQGIQGEQGDKGDTGETGLTGDEGKIGPVGPQGLKGNPGTNGLDGLDGKDGKDGRKVELRKSDTHVQWRYVGELLWKDLILLAELKGAQGKIGPQGEKGARGDRGIEGFTGPRGPIGPVGFTGPAGPQGDTGATGAQGDEGPQGIQGIQGPQGDPGANIGYVLTGYHAALSPADSTTYYWGNLFTSQPSINAVREQIYIPKTGTIKRIDMRWNYTNGTPGFNTEVYIRLNNTTDTPVTTTLDLSNSPTVVSKSDLAIAVVAGDYIELKYVTPAWTPTNPTAVACSATLYIE